MPSACNSCANSCRLHVGSESCSIPTGGGLASYQSDIPAIFRRAAALVDKILKGEKPAEIPFEQSTKLELVIDKKAAKAFGIAVPQALLLSADEVIE